MGLILAEIASAQDWASLKETFMNIRSVKAEFLQKRYLKILTKPLLSEGKLYFYIPDSLRWEYLSPLRTVMLQKENTIQVYNFSEGTWKPEMAQAVEARRMVLAEISQWFQGRFDESKAFKHVYSPGPPARVTMVPGDALPISRVGCAGSSTGCMSFGSPRFASVIAVAAFGATMTAPYFVPFAMVLNWSWN